MSMLILTCKCGQQMKVPESALGKTGTCVGCSKRLKITNANTAQLVEYEVASAEHKEVTPGQQPVATAEGVLGTGESHGEPDANVKDPRLSPAKVITKEQRFQMYETMEKLAQDAPLCERCKGSGQIQTTRGEFVSCSKCKGSGVVRGTVSGLEQCEVCGANVATEAQTCPHCGAKGPAKKREQKEKQWAYLAAFIILAFLVIALVRFWSSAGSRSSSEEHWEIYYRKRPESTLNGSGVMKGIINIYYDPTYVSPTRDWCLRTAREATKKLGYSGAQVRFFSSRDAAWEGPLIDERSQSYWHAVVYKDYPNDFRYSVVPGS